MPRNLPLVVLTQEESVCVEHVLYLPLSRSSAMRDAGRKTERKRDEEKERNVTPSLAGPCHQLLAQ